MIRKKPAPDLIRGGDIFPKDHAPRQQPQTAGGLRADSVPDSARLNSGVRLHTSI